MSGRLRLPAPTGQLLVAALLMCTGASGELAAQMATYRLDKDYTAINFSWSHLGLSRQSARLTAAEGRVNFDPANPEASAIDVTMKAANITTGIRDFDFLLKSPEYFNAAQFPLIMFKSTAIRQLSDKTGQVMGDLTIKGITRPVALNVVWPRSIPTIATSKSRVSRQRRCCAARTGISRSRCPSYPTRSASASRRSCCGANRTCSPLRDRIGPLE